MKRFFLIVTLLLGLLACGSTGAPGRSTVTSYDDDSYYIPDGYDSESSARPEAYAADHMLFRTPAPDRRGERNWEFFYKHCSMNGNETYYSKTSYDCTGPYAQ